MIKPDGFPYIKSLYVNDCYAYKDFNIQLNDYKPFSHLILTGKNGSGKSTILKHLSNYIAYLRSGRNPETEYKELVRAINENRADHWPLDYRKGEQARLEKLNIIKPTTNDVGNDYWALNQNQIIYSYFEAKKSYVKQYVDGPTKEIEFNNKLNSEDSTNYFTSKFKQYLVNKRIGQAFAQIEQKTEQLIYANSFFETLRQRFSEILGQQITGIDFDHNNYEFYFNIEDGRCLTFDTLSDGAYALFSTIMDLFMRVDLIRKQVGDYSYDPCGIVLIDEPETHLHLQLQEQVLPLLTNLFPNVQFIVATHSPAVIASIKNATIFDLTTKETRISEEAVGRSYSELMRAHFGMNNEYSGIADELFKKVDQILKENKNRPEELKAKLQQFFIENEAYFSPSFRVELESMILENA